ncbi:MAG: NepR family anti-sigma factor [Pseudomonadota bacterium]
MSKDQKHVSEHVSEIDRQIDENLRMVFDETVREEIPDRFKDLIAQLKAKETGDSQND